MKIAAIYTCWGLRKNKQYSGVGFYRIIQPFKHLKGYEIDVYGENINTLGKNREEVYHNLFSTYDLIWTKHVDSPLDASALGFCSQHYKKPLVIDLDDDYYNIRDDQPASEVYYSGSQKRAYVGAFLSLASKITVSTQPLAWTYAKEMKKRHGKQFEIDILPNFNDFDEFKYGQEYDNGDKVVIGWQGSTTHFADLKMVLPHIDRLMDKYPNVYLELLGGVEMERAGALFKGIKNIERISVNGGTQSWEGYPKLLSEQKWDIGICPLVDDKFNRGKSHIKWLEYSAYKIPTVASNVYPYYKDILGVKTIQDGSTGFLCEEFDWYEKLEKLVLDKDLRKQIAQNSYEYVRDHWQPNNWIDKWKNTIDNLI